MPPYQYADTNFHDANMIKMQMRLLYDANFPCKDAQFIHDDANAPLWVCHDANAFFTRRKCNLSKNFFYFLNRGFLGA